ncbi:MAG: hypothetical protein QM731_24315 [Chitinophagaceae bacterium]
MRYIIFSLIPLLVFTIMGCKKDKAGEADCHVIVITPSSGAPVNFYYNNEGKLETIKEGLTITSFIYKGDSIIATKTNTTVLYEKRRYKINGNGLPSNLRIESDRSGNNWANYSYEYNGTELKKITTTASSSGLSLVSNYTWTNGNITSSTDGTSIHSYEYYSDKTYRAGDASNLMAMLYDYGMEVIHTKNMRKSDQYTSPSGSYTLNYNYSFNSDGKVTIATENSLSFNLQYQCN